MYIYLPSLKISSLREKDCPHLFSLRPQLEQVFTFTDLNGNIRPAKIYKLDKKTKTVDLTWLGDIVTHETSKNRMLIQAIPEKLYLEKLFEILPHSQISEIYLYHSHRSLKQNINFERLQKILIRSCEQSENVFLPKLKMIANSEDLHRLLAANTPLVLEAEASKETKLSQNKIQNQAVLVGPEGGFSDFEIAEFKEVNLQFYSLGDIVYPSWLAGLCYFQQTS